MPNVEYEIKLLTQNEAITERNFNNSLKQLFYFINLNGHKLNPDNYDDFKQYHLMFKGKNGQFFYVGEDYIKEKTTPLSLETDDYNLRLFVFQDEPAIFIYDKYIEILGKGILYMRTPFIDKNKVSSDACEILIETKNNNDDLQFAIGKGKEKVNFKGINSSWSYNNQTQSKINFCHICDTIFNNYKDNFKIDTNSNFKIPL